MWTPHSVAEADRYIRNALLAAPTANEAVRRLSVAMMEWRKGHGVDLSNQEARVGLAYRIMAGRDILRRLRAEVTPRAAKIRRIENNLICVRRRRAIASAELAKASGAYSNRFAVLIDERQKNLENAKRRIANKAARIARQREAQRKKWPRPRYDAVYHEAMDYMDAVESPCWTRGIRGRGTGSMAGGARHHIGFSEQQYVTDTGCYRIAPAPHQP